MSSNKLALILLFLTVGTALFVVVLGIFGSSAEQSGEPVGFSIPFINLASNVLFWKIITFGFLTAVLSFLWDKIIFILDSRKAKVRKSLDNAEHNRVEAEKLLQERKAILLKARKDAFLMLEKACVDSKKAGEKILEEARLEVAHLRDRTMEEIKSVELEVREKLKMESVELSIFLASKILGRSLSVQDHQNLIDKAISKYQVY